MPRPYGHMPRLLFLAAVITLLTAMSCLTGRKGGTVDLPGAPDWVRDLKAPEKYQNEKYMSGVGLFKKEGEDDATAARSADDKARGEIALQVFASVRQVVESVTQEASTVSSKGSKFSSEQLVKLTSKSESDLQLPATEIVERWKSKDGKHFASVATMNRQKAAIVLQGQLQEGEKNIVSLFASAKKAVEGSENPSAFKFLIMCKKHFADFTNKSGMFIAISGKRYVPDANTPGVSDLEKLHNSLIDKINFAVAVLEPVEGRDVVNAAIVEKVKEFGFPVKLTGTRYTDPGSAFKALTGVADFAIVGKVNAFESSRMNPGGIPLIIYRSNAEIHIVDVGKQSVFGSFTVEAGDKTAGKGSSEDKARNDSIMNASKIICESLESKINEVFIGNK